MNFSKRAADLIRFPVDLDGNNHVVIPAVTGGDENHDLRIKVRLAADILLAGRDKLLTRRANNSQLKTDNALVIDFYNLRNIALAKRISLVGDDAHIAHVCAKMGDTDSWKNSGILNEVSLAISSASHGRYKLGTHTKSLAVVDYKHVYTLSVGDETKAVCFKTGEHPVYVCPGFSSEQLSKLQEAELNGLSQQELGYDESVSNKTLLGVCARTNSVFTLLGSSDLCCRIRGDKIMLLNMADENHRAYDQKYLYDQRSAHKKRRAKGTTVLAL